MNLHTIRVLIVNAGLSIYAGWGLGVMNATYGMAFFALSMALNITLTLLIVGRMLYLRRKVIKVLGVYHGRMYTSIAMMFFESGLLYTSIGIFYLVCRATESDVQFVIMQPLGQVVVRSSDLNHHRPSDVQVTHLVIVSHYSALLLS